MPKIKIDIDKIVVQVRHNAEGFFNIKNTGGGTLAGVIFSNTDCIEFNPDYFEGNNVKIRYVVSSGIYGNGDIIHANILISSNGGELKIPVVIKIITETIETIQKFEINSLKDFLSYSKKYPIDARRMIGTNEFIFWLQKIGFEHIEILEHIIKDSNKERALDNFLTLTKLKKKAYIEPNEKNINLKIRPISNEEIKSFFTLNKIGWGYIESEIELKNNCKWIELEKNKITNKDFDDSGKCIINYKVKSNLIADKFTKETVIINNPVKSYININVIKLPLLKLQFNKECYNLADRGFLKIENNTGSDLAVIIKTSDNFIKFNSENYYIKDSKEIYFDIKVTGILKTQMEFIKKPYIESEIYIKTNIESKILKYTKSIIIGDSLV